MVVVVVVVVVVVAVVLIVVVVVKGEPLMDVTRPASDVKVKPIEGIRRKER